MSRATRAADKFCNVVCFILRGRALTAFSGIVLCVVCCVRVARAQSPEIGGLLPAGGLRGQSTHIRIDGKNLAGARLFVSGTGIAVTGLQAAPDGNSLAADVTVEADARLGPREIRIATPKGISNGSRFWIDLVPNRVIETPMLETTPPLVLDGASPVVLNGRIANPAGRDRFTFRVAAGDCWTFDCYADRIRSRLDPVLELKDANGVSLRLVQSTWEDDPRFCYRFTKPGTYFLTLRDSEYHSGPNFTYRLLVGRTPFVSGFAPRGGKPGQSLNIALQGTNLPFSRASVTIPQDTPPGLFLAEILLPSGSSGPLVLPLLVTALNVFDAGSGGNIRALPALPVAADGTFLHSSTSRFTFHAAAKITLLFDLYGRRIGSRIDGAVRILDSAGKELAANDDAPGLGKEARVEFSPTADDEYTAEVRNVEEVTGPNCYYRLEVTPVVPDLKVSIVTDRLAIPIGGTIVLPVTVERLGGWDGPIEVNAENLPPGVVCTGGLVPAGKSAVDITLTAALDTGLNAADVRITGKASMNGKPVVRQAPSWEKYEHRSIDLGLAVEFSYTRPFHLWELLLCATTERTDSITVSLSPAPLHLAPGGTLEIPVHITRQANGAGEIKLDVRGLPAKVSANAAPIPAGQNEGKIILTAAPDATPDIANIIVQAHRDQNTALAPAIRLTLQKN